MKSIPYLISSLLCAESDPVIINTVFELLTPQDIGKTHGALYSLLLDCWTRHKVLEPVAIHIEILSRYPDEQHRNNLIAQLHELWGLVCQPILWHHYLKLALWEVKIMKLKEVGSKLNTTNDPKTVDDSLGEILVNINSIIQKYRLAQHETLDSITDEYLQYIDDAITNQKQNIIKTGYYYESKVNGFRPGDYIILAGRPKMGKSAVANAIVARALKAGKRVMLINNEMDKVQVENRLYACLYDLMMDSLQNPSSMTDYQIKQLMGCTEEFRKLPLHLYCFRFKNPAQIETEARRLSALGTPIDLLVIDHLGLFMPNQKTTGTYEKVSVLSWEVKMLAADLNVPVLALAQLSRKCEDRPNKRPTASDLRDSGSLEQDASAVMLIYRDEYYNPNTTEKGVCEINVAVNRNGKTGVDKYRIDLDRMSLYDLDTRSEK